MVTPPATLLVDAGNSRLKWALLRAGQRSAQQALSYADPASRHHQPTDTVKAALCHLEGLLVEHEPEQLVLVHVLGEVFSENIQVLCQRFACRLNRVSSSQGAYGINVAYANPLHFGADRLVGLVAARYFAKLRPVIIIDCGTAVTVDALEPEGHHLGGVILPGLGLLSDALVQRTQAKHMAASLFTDPHVFKDNTAQAIGSGCLFTLVGAIEGICQRMQQNMSACPVKIICGGDAPIVCEQLSADYRLETAALMAGLQVIAECS